MLGRLERDGYVVERAASGAEAVARATRPEADPPEMVLLDLGLPDEDLHLQPMRERKFAARKRVNQVALALSLATSALRTPSVPAAMSSCARLCWLPCANLGVDWKI